MYGIVSIGSGARLAVVFASLALAGCISGVTNPAKTDARRSVVNTASAQVGAPYKYGGADRTGFDAEGLVYFAYRESGFNIPSRIEGQLRAGQPIRFTEVRPGDLLFYRIEQARANKDNVLHVGLYIGNGDMVHATLDNDEVVFDPVDTPFWLRRLVGVIKVLP